MIKKSEAWLLILLMGCLIEADAKTIIADIKLCSEPVEYKGVAYFCADHSLFGKEPFKTTGDQLDLRVLKDIDPGPGSSNPLGFFVYKGFLFFVAETSANGWSLYRTDGTQSGTKLISPRLLTHGETSSSSSSGLAVTAVVDGFLYFQILTDDYEGKHLFKTDGTFANTTRIDVPTTDAYEVIGHHRKATKYAILNGALFVQTNDELYRINDNATSSLIASFPSGPPNNYYVGPELSPTSRFNNNLIITATSDTGEPETWISNGTSSQTRRLLSGDYNSGEINGNLVVFKANRQENFFETKFIDSQLQQVKLGRGVALAPLNNFNAATPAIVGNKLLLRGPYSLWSTDGTLPGTIALPIHQLSQCALHNQNFYCISENELYKTDGSISGTELISNFESNGSFCLLPPTDSHVFFLIERDLWKTGVGKTDLVKKNLLSRNQHAFCTQSWNEGNRIYFQAQDSESGEIVLFHSNGTEQSSYVLKYTYDDGLPDIPSLERKAVLPPIIDLLLNAEDNSTN